MARAFIVVLIASLAVSGCGGSSPIAQGPTPSSVAVQQTDLPSGMVKCDLTGDIDSFLNKEKTADPSTYQSTKTEWDDAKSKGATATYKLVVNFVIQFKDDSSAAKGYTSEKLFNVSAAELRSSGQAVVEGTKTGLSPNSIVLNTPIGNQTYYIAVWQKKSFMVILAMLNLDATASKKVATGENDRIK